MNFNLKDNQTKVIRLKPLDKMKNPTTVDQSQNTVVWTSLDPANLTITPVEDGTAANFDVTGPLGVYEWTVMADVNMDPDTIESLMETHTITSIASNATDLGPTEDAPVDKP